MFSIFSIFSMFSMFSMFSQLPSGMAGWNNLWSPGMFDIRDLQWKQPVRQNLDFFCENMKILRQVCACISNVCISRADRRSRTKSRAGRRGRSPCAQHSDLRDENENEQAVQIQSESCFPLFFLPINGNEFLGNSFGWNEKVIDRSPRFNHIETLVSGYNLVIMKLFTMKWFCWGISYWFQSSVPNFSIHCAHGIDS